MSTMSLARVSGKTKFVFLQFYGRQLLKCFSTATPAQATLSTLAFD